VLGDLLSESNETFFVRLANPTNATLGQPLGQGTILDDDPLPSLFISDGAVTENASGPTSMVFSVTLSAVSGKAVSVKYASSNGTATASADFVARTGSLLFPAGVTAQSLPITVNRALLAEPSEYFYVNLSDPRNAILANSQGVGTIGSQLPARASSPEMIFTEARILRGGFLLRFATSPGERYRVEQCRDLSDGSDWQPVPGAGEIAGTGAIVEFIDSNAASSPQRFYRLRRLP